LASETTSVELLVNCDQTQLQQVIINLALNAMDAMSAVPAVTRNISISTTRVEKFADVMVSDTGPGISADILKSVFELFFSTKPQGMGMGLSIVRSIVEAHGGQIWTEGKTGNGAVFHIRLPLSGT
jgi:signal transduction histidine kinase